MDSKQIVTRSRSKMAQKLHIPSLTTLNSAEYIAGSEEINRSLNLNSTKTKQRRVKSRYQRGSLSGKSPAQDVFCKLSLELMCHIAKFLPIFDVMKLERLCGRWREAVSLHLKLLHQIDLCESQIYGWMPAKFTDDTFGSFLKRCNAVTHIYGLHPQKVVRRWSRKSHELSVPGIIAALQNCPCLTGIEISNIFLLEDVLTYLPHINILGCFANRNGSFPIPLSNKFSLVSNYRIVSLNLTGVVVECLPRMGALEDMYVKCVLFTDPLPFRNFAAPFLKTFVMNNCAGPTNTLKYVPMVTALAAASELQRLELIRVPFLGGLFQHVVEDSWRLQGFRQLSTLTIATCKHAMEADLGYLAITAATKLQKLSIQPSLTKDSLFSSLHLAEVEFPLFNTLQLGYVNAFPPQGRYSNEELSYMGLADVTETPPSLTDAGLKAAARVFTNAHQLTIYNCPNLHNPTNWMAPGLWSVLRELHLHRCHALNLAQFCLFLPTLPSLLCLHLTHMFREPPKGCSRVGLSAGTGLGVSSAFVANQAEHNHPLPDDNNNNESDEELEAEDVLLQEAEGNPVAAAAAAVGDADGPQQAQPPERAADQDLDLDPVEVVLEDGLYYLASYNEDQGEDGASGLDPGTSTGHQPLSCSEASCSKSVDFQNSSEDGIENELHGDSGKGQGDNGQSPGSSKSTAASAPIMHDDLPRVVEGQPGCSKDSIDINNPEPGCSQEAGSVAHSPGASPAAATPHGTGKGKSLSGKKKGLVKKQASACDDQHDQSCQAVSEEIRESTTSTHRLASESGENGTVDDDMCQSRSSQTACVCCGRESSRETAEQTCQQGHKAVSDVATDGKSALKRKSAHGKHAQLGNEGPAANTRACRASENRMRHSKVKAKRKVHLKDQATSTSDPIIDEDHVQELNISSSCLQSIILEGVGITDLVLTQCPNLLNLTVRRCRVLNKVRVVKAPRLACLTVAQCRKLNHPLLVKEVCSQPSETNRLIILRPVTSYSVGDMERALLQPASINYHTYLLHDYTSSPAEALETRMKVDCWLDILMGITRGILKVDNVRACRDKSSEKKYPWGRNIFRVHGKNKDETYWELVTDIPWIRTQTLFTPGMLARLSHKTVVLIGYGSCCADRLKTDTISGTEAATADVPVSRAHSVTIEPAAPSSGDPSLAVVKHERLSTMRLNMLLALGIILGLIGASLLVALSLWYVKPYMRVSDMVRTTCATETFISVNYLVTCTCDGSSSCLSKYPCVQLGINFTDKSGDERHNVTLYNSYETFLFQDAMKKCSYHRCGRATRDNIEAVKRFSEKYGPIGSSFPCYYRPSQPDFAVLDIISLQTVIQCIVWPALAVVTGIAMLAAHLLIDDVRSKRKTRQFNSLERPWMRHVERSYEKVESDT